MAEPVEQAEKVTGVVAAAKLRERLYLAGEDAQGAEAYKYDVAVDRLDARFPELENVPLEFGAAEKWAEARGQGSMKRPRGSVVPAKQAPTRKSGQGANTPQTGSQRPTARRSAPKPAGSARSGRSKGRRRLAQGYLLGRSGRRYAEQTGLPGAARFGLRGVLSTVGLVIGLSMLYLFLTNAERSKGNSAIELVTAGIASALERLIDASVDPLAVGAAAVAAKGKRSSRPQTIKPGKDAALPPQRNAKGARVRGHVERTAPRLPSLPRRPGTVAA